MMHYLPSIIYWSAIYATVSMFATGAWAILAERMDWRENSTLIAVFCAVTWMAGSAVCVGSMMLMGFLMLVGL